MFYAQVGFNVLVNEGFAVIFIDIAVFSMLEIGTKSLRDGFGSAVLSFEACSLFLNRNVLCYVLKVDS